MTMKRIISYILFLVLGISTVFNILFLFKKIEETLLWAGFAGFISVLFVVSALGLIMKNIKKEDVVSINIVTPVKELGALYVFMLIAWVATYFITVIFR